MNIALNPSKQNWKLSHQNNGAIFYNISEINNSEYHQHQINFSEIRKLLFSYQTISFDTTKVITTTDNCSNDYLSNHHQYSSSTFINDVLNSSIDIDSECIDYSSVSKVINTNTTSEFHAQFPIFYDTIKIPTKVATTIKRYTPKKLLYQIHQDIDVAVEMCLLFVSQLSSTYFSVKDKTNPEGWKALKSEYLRQLIPTHPMAYKNARTALEYPLKNGAIIECDHSYCKGEKSFNYRLGDTFIQKGIVSYQLKTDAAKTALNSFYASINLATKSNPISQNLAQVYSIVTLPKNEEIIAEAHKLVDAEYTNKKGSKLKFLNKKSKNYFKNPDQICFVEHAIELFDFLKESFGRILSNGTPESGGRVVDMFTLMPSWIRKLVKIDGFICAECDYSALHPNIAMALYKGNSPYLQHNELAIELGIDVGIIKTEHLSFFNKKVWQMKQSPLFNYYQKKEPQLLQNIINEKQNSEFKHKITSRRMFEKEVEIMKDVITQLNGEGIYVLYIYDALLCNPKYANRVVAIMNAKALKHGVKTRAKCSIEINQTAIKKQDSSASDKYFTAEQIAALQSFNPPIEKVLNTHLQMKFARDYVIENAEKLKSHCYKKWEFELMVDRLVANDFNQFENDLKALLKYDYKDYMQQKTAFVNANYQN